MRNKLLLLAITLVVALASVNGSIAYFTSKDRTSNVFTMGAVAVELTEPSWNPEDSHPLLAGAVYDKDPLVTNTGSSEAFVRMRLSVSDYAALAAHAPADYDLTSMFNIGSGWVPSATPRVHDDTITYTYTYTEALPAHASTTPLFTLVNIPPFISTDLIHQLGGALDVSVQADAIQASGFANHTEAFAAFDQQMGA